MLRKNSGKQLNFNIGWMQLCGGLAEQEQSWRRCSNHFKMLANNCIPRHLFHFNSQHIYGLSIDRTKKDNLWPSYKCFIMLRGSITFLCQTTKDKYIKLKKRHQVSSPVDVYSVLIHSAKWIRTNVRSGCWIFSLNSSGRKKCQSQICVHERI